MTRFRIVGCGLAWLLVWCSQVVAQPATSLCQWNQELLAAIRREATAPGLAARRLAILHAALYDGLVSAHGGTGFILASHELTGAVDDELFINLAAARMAAVFYPSYTGLYREKANEALAACPAELRDSTRQFAEAVVDKSLHLRDGDGSANTLTYVPKDQIGLWKRTPPSFRPPELSHWANMRPFVISRADAFRPPPPPALDSREYAEAVNEVRVYGSASPQECLRSDDQTHIADYWSCFSYTSTPAGHWNEILCRIFADQKEKDLIRVARGYAVLNIAMADAGIAAWDCKYHYEFWRPIQAIRMADRDGNPLTEPDPQWDSHLEAPPHPEYVSGHSTFSAAGAAVLAWFFGSDTFTFVSANPLFPGEERVYHSFSECAAECGQSRIYGGIHFSFSNREGLNLGKRVAEHVCQHVFRNS